MGNLAAFSSNPLRDPAESSLNSAHHVHSPDFKASLRPAVLGVRVVFRVFFLSNFPSFSQLIFFRKEAILKRTYCISSSHHRDFHMDVTKCPGDSLRGHPGAGPRSFSGRGGGGQPRAPSAGRPRSPRGRHVTGKSLGNPLWLATHTTQRQKKGTAQSAAFAPEKCHGL